MDSKHSTTLFRAFYAAALKKDFEAVADMIDEECEYVLEPDMEIAKGKQSVLEMAGRSSLAFDKTQPEISLTLPTRNGAFSNSSIKVPFSKESSPSPRNLRGDFRRAPALSWASGTKYRSVSSNTSTREESST
jgi:hypothetical protein